MTTPYELLERIAAEVAQSVPGEISIIHVEAGFDQHPFALNIAVTPYHSDTLYDLSKRTPIDVSPELIVRLRRTLIEYYRVVAPLQEQYLILLRVSVKNDGDFLMGQSFTQEPTLTTLTNIGNP